MLEDYGQYQNQKTKKIGSFLLSLLFYTGICLATAYVIPHTVSNHLKTVHKNIITSIPNGDKLHNMLFWALKPQQILFHQAEEPFNLAQQGLYQIETPCIENNELLERQLNQLQQSNIAAKKTTYHNTNKTCNKIHIGPFSHYAVAQKTHIALQTMKLDHHIVTER